MTRHSPHVEIMAVWPLQVLQGRVAGRNSEDAAQIKAGLLDLQAQWKSFESSAQQVGEITCAV